MINVENVPYGMIPKCQGGTYTSCIICRSMGKTEISYIYT